MATFNTRIGHKYDTEANFANATFSPIKGELIIYAPDSTHSKPRFKVGDGSTAIGSLPFVDIPLPDFTTAEDGLVLKIKDGALSWETDNDTIYTLPLATSSARGGIKIGYSASGANIPVKLSSEKAYVTLTETAISSAGGITSVTAGNGLTGGATSGTATLNVGAGTGIEVTADAVGLATVDSVTAGQYGVTSDTTPAYSGNIVIPTITVDDYGRVTAVTDTTITLPADNSEALEERVDTIENELYGITTDGTYQFTDISHFSWLCDEMGAPAIFDGPFKVTGDDRVFNFLKIYRDDGDEGNSVIAFVGNDDDWVQDEDSGLYLGAFYLALGEWSDILGKSITLLFDYQNYEGDAYWIELIDLCCTEGQLLNGLIDRVTTLETNVTTNTSTISTHTTELSTLNDTVSSNVSRIAALESQIGDHEERINALEDSDSSGGSTTVTVNPPTISLTTDGVLTITKPSSGTTPTSYYIYVNGARKKTVSYSSSSQTVDLWPTVAPLGAGSYSIYVKSYASSVTSSSSSSETYDLTAVTDSGNFTWDYAGEGYDYPEDITYPYTLTTTYNDFSYSFITSNSMTSYWSVTVTKDDYNVISSVSFKDNNAIQFTVNQTYGSYTVLAKYTAIVDGDRRWVHETVTGSLDFCLLKGTQILMADGSTKAIEDIRSGDWLKSWDFENNEYINVRCLAAYSTGEHSNWKEYTFDNNSTLRIAEAHAVYSKERGFAAPSTSWAIDETGIGLGGYEAKLKKIVDKLNDKPVEHYSLIVENNLYFADGILCGHWPGKKWSAYIGNAIKYELTADQIELFKTEHEESHKDVDWKQDPVFLIQAREYGRYNDVDKEEKGYRRELADRDYKTIKRMQGLLSDEEWETNLKECEDLRAKVNECANRRSKILAHHRAVRESLGYPARPRTDKKRYQDGYSADLAFIRARNMEQGIE